MSHQSKPQQTTVIEKVVDKPDASQSHSGQKATGIYIEGARTHNLKNVTCTIPYEKLTVITGPSGSGKSTLAFDTLYAEGQRRFLESLSTYARQFLTRFEKPDVDQVRHVLPAIALEQKNGIKNARSTVGTITEIDDYLRLLFSHIGTQVDKSGKPIIVNNAETISQHILAQPEGSKILIAAECNNQNVNLEQLILNGYFRWVNQEEIQEFKPSDKLPKTFDLLIDRLIVRPDTDPTRVKKALTTALEITDTNLNLWQQLPNKENYQAIQFSKTDSSLKELSPHLFSFNSPIGACQACEGYGKVIGLDLNKVVPNRNISLSDGAIHPFNTPSNFELYELMMATAHSKKIRTGIPYGELSNPEKEFVLHGSGQYPGVIGFFDWLETKKYKMHVRVFLAKYRSYSKCPTCNGSRLKPESLEVLVGGKNIYELQTMPVDKLLAFVNHLNLTDTQRHTTQRILEELNARLSYLNNIGLGYLSLNRQSRTLSGGESQRINLASALGTNLTDTLYVLDEPTVGLHAKDTEHLLFVLRQLRDVGNTVVVVEHDPDMICGADQVLELGPEGGSDGGYVVHDGTVETLLNNPLSKTGQYLQQLKSNFKKPEAKNNLKNHKTFSVTNASGHNLKNITVDFPVNQLVGISGVSGSGKSTLIKQTLYANYQQAKGQELTIEAAHCDNLKNLDQFEDVVMVDQTPPGRSARSNPATYVKAYDEIRKLLASSREAKAAGLAPGDFSFNSEGGRCEKCEGLGYLTIDMQFMADVRVTCTECKGQRFMPHVLAVEYNEKNVYQILSLTITEAVQFFKAEPKIIDKLMPLIDVGLGYIQLGQETATLSGGEAQRLKLSSYLAECRSKSRSTKKPYLLLFDEPSTGLHISDIQKLITVFEQLVEAGHSLVVIEHNIDLLLQMDWLIDLGPEAGINGGQVVAQGSIEDVIKNKASITGQYLDQRLNG